MATRKTAASKQTRARNATAGGADAKKAAIVRKVRSIADRLGDELADRLEVARAAVKKGAATARKRAAEGLTEAGKTARTEWASAKRAARKAVKTKAGEVYAASSRKLEELEGKGKARKTAAKVRKTAAKAPARKAAAGGASTVKPAARRATAARKKPAGK